MDPAAGRQTPPASPLLDVSETGPGADDPFTQVTRPRPAPTTGRRRARRRRASAQLVIWRAVTSLGVVLVLVALAPFVPGSPLAALGGHGPILAAPSGTATATAAPTPSPTPPPLPPLRFRDATVTVSAQGFLSWAVMDRRTGEIFGSTTMTGTTWPASMIKPWLAADDLRRLTEAGRSPSSARLRELEIMIRDSDNNAAQAAYLRNGGVASIKRLISMCELTDTKATSKGWSFTTISARDTVRMADCIADGTAAGPKWTGWLLRMMRTVRLGDWGIRKALPADEAATVSIKNGWLFYDDDRNWHINCLAVTSTWAMAVLQRYPGHGRYDSDFAAGQKVCRDVARQLLNPDYVAPD